MSSDAVHPAPKPIMFANIAAQSEIAERKAQITVLLAVNAKLKQDMAMQGHAYRGLQLVLDETKEDLADMEARMNAEQAHCVHLRAEMGKIKELVNKCGV
jgi:methylaspartate ammonia-lyase|tara:strand:+ start:21831 stop:22130 length:300 start_codon:yes stop_codon:yes gene_type:complete